MTVKTARLDTFLARERSPNLRLALWIDVEGKAHEVLEGAAGILGCVQLLHVEVETAPCIAPHQKLYPEVKAFLTANGFEEAAADGPIRRAQINALFVRRDLPVPIRFQVTLLAQLARVRGAITRPLRWMLRARREPR